MKRILALIICFGISVMNFPMALMQVSADTAGTVSVDKTFNYTSVEAAEADGWSGGDEYVKLTVADNGSACVTQIKQKVLNDKGGANGEFSDEITYKLPKGIVEEDTVNRTKLITENGKYTGKVQFVITGQYNMGTKSTCIENNVSIPASNNAMYLRGNETAALIRVRPTSLSLLNADSSSSNNVLIQGSTSTLMYCSPKVSATVTVAVDTKAETLTGSVSGKDYVASGDTWAKNDGKDLKYIDRLSISHAQRLPADSSATAYDGAPAYSRIDSLTITTLEPEYGTETAAMLEALPETLVKNVNAVTESQIELPEIDGVTWTSSDESVALISGNVADITRTKGQDKEVSIKASFTTDGIEYTKEYSLTVLKSQNVVKYYIDGDLYDSVEIADGGFASDISAPAKEHYDFVGWCLEDGAKFDFSAEITDHVSLYAKYEPKTYEVKFYADNLIDTVQVKYGETVGDKLPDIPEKEGYTSLGWVIGDTDVAFDETTVITGPDTVINAKYIEGTFEKYTVVFNVDGTKYAEVEVLENTAVAMTETPEKENYIFEYWMLNGAEYDFSAPVTSDIVLEAKFRPVPLEVEFYTDSTMTELHYTGTGYYNEKYGDLPQISKPQYIFKNWKTGDGEVFTTDTVITEPVKVYAEWESAVKVILDEDITKYTSLTGNLVEFAVEKTSTINTYLDNGVIMEVYRADPTGTDVATPVIGTIKILIEEDNESRTRTVNNRLIGDYEIAVTYDTKLSDAWTDTMSAPYGMYSIGLSNSTGSLAPIHFNRLFKKVVRVYNAASASSNTMKDELGTTPPALYYSNPVSDGYYENVTLRTRYNTATNESTVSVDGYEKTGMGSGVTNVAFVNGFSFKMIERFNIGDFLKIKHVKVTQYDVDVNDPDYITVKNTLELLPDSLAEDPYNVTDDIVLPAIENVEWSSSDEKVISSADGSVTKWYNDVDVVVTATVISGNYAYSKEYTLTVKADERTENEVVIDRTFTTEDSLNNWTFVNMADSETGDYTVSENGLTIKKITDSETPNSKKETRRYFAFYDFYSEESSDTYTVTEARDKKGVYDISFDLSSVSKSTVPKVIGIGYRKDTVFYSYGTLKLSSNGAVFTYNTSDEVTESVNINIVNGDNVKFRVDNNLGEICLFVNGERVTERIPYHFSLNGECMINSLMVALDLNNEIDESVTIKNLKVERMMGESIAALDDALKAANSIGIEIITDTPDSVSGEINTLPQKIGDYKISWYSSSNQIDMESGEVFCGPSAQRAVLTAEVYDENSEYPVVVRKSFELNISAASTPEELGKYNINELGRITNQSYDDIRYDLNLPQIPGITWVSSDTSVIGNDGKINGNAVITEPVKITFTATSNGVSKDYALTVTPRTPQEILTFNENVKKVSSDIAISYNYINSSTEGKLNIVDETGKVIASMVSTETGIYFDYRNSDYKEYTDENAEIKFLIMPDVDKIAVWVNGVLAVDYADFKTPADYVSGVNSTIDVGPVTYTTDKYGMLTANIDNLDYFGDVEYGYASDTVNLPVNVLTLGKVEWSSSDTSILKNDGAYTAPDVMTMLDLNFKITDTENSGIYISRDFVIAADCSNSKNLLKDIVPVVSKHQDEAYPKGNVNDNDIKSVYTVVNANNGDSDVIFDLGEEKSFNTFFIGQNQRALKNFVISVSDDGSLWKEVVSGSAEGEVSKLIKFEITSARYVKFTIKECTDKNININEVKLFLSVSKAEFAQIDLGLISVPSAANSSKITLPSTGVNGTAFSWESSNPDVISANGDITRPSTATTVILTAIATVDGIKYTKEFPVYVDVKSASGPSQSGGSGGGGGGSFVSSQGAAGIPAINNDEPVYEEDLKQAETAKNIYSDVNESDWYYEDVVNLTNNGIVSGDGTGKFNPKDNVTREQFVKMILEAIDIEVAGGEHTFKDVVSGAWYEDYIATAVKNSIVKGLSDTEFGIGSNITRQDMAVLIERVLNYKNVEIEKAGVEPFADADQVSSYASEAVANMRAIGLIQGYNNKYNPKDNLTRAEAATVIASLLELLA